MTESDAKTETSQKAEKYCFIMLTNTTPFKEVQARIKPLGGFYNGAGWCVPFKHKDVVAEICATTKSRPIEMILEGSFDSFRRAHNVAYYNEKSIKINLEINKLKRLLGIHDLANDVLPVEIEQIEEGKKLFALLQEQQALRDQIARAEAEEKIKHLSKREYSHLMELNSLAALKDELQQISSNIHTGYTIARESLELPGGALTIVAAPTSHGKTTFMINLALGVINHNPTKNVFFFTYEEARASIQTIFINTYIKKELSKNNRKSIKHYFKTGRLEYISRIHHEQFEKDVLAFEKHLFETGRLRVIYSEMAIEELIKAIHYIKERDEDAVIFIDYMQFLRSLNGGRSRQEELKNVCIKLKDCAITTGVPIIIAAQFNRTVVCEADLSPVAIGEAGDIERAANMIIGLWNRNFTGFSREGNKTKDGKKIEKESTIYIEIMKRRDDTACLSEVMNFNGKTGEISNQIIPSTTNSKTPNFG